MSCCTRATTAGVSTYLSFVLNQCIHCSAAANIFEVKQFDVVNNIHSSFTTHDLSRFRLHTLLLQLLLLSLSSSGGSLLDPFHLIEHILLSLLLISLAVITISLIIIVTAILTVSGGLFGLDCLSYSKPPLQQ
jgi:hypothetical protein